MDRGISSFVSKEWWLHSFQMNKNEYPKWTNENRGGEKSQKEEGISVQQTSQIFCCIQHIRRRQGISYGSLHSYLKPRRQSSISRQLFLRCLCQPASYSSWLLSLGPFAATGCRARAEKPAHSVPEGTGGSRCWRSQRQSHRVRRELCWAIGTGLEGCGRWAAEKGVWGIN